MKQCKLLSLVLPFLIQLINPYTLSKNQISSTVNMMNDMEVISLNKDTKGNPEPEELERNIRFTQSGLTCYFKHIYNCPQYAQDTLTRLPFKHLDEFINHGIKSQQSRSYIKAVFRLFDKKFKSVPFIDADEIVPFLQNLPKLLDRYLMPDPQKKFFVKNLIRFELENNFETLKRNPDLFLDNLAGKIVESDTISNEELTRDDLKTTVTKFIETFLNKAFWSTSDKELWQNFLNIGKELHSLRENNIIKSDEDLDDCQWTLTTRFCLFLSLSGSALPGDFYQQANLDLHKEITHLDALEEQEELIMPKKTHLQSAIVNGYGKLQGRLSNSGILSEPIIINN